MLRIRELESLGLRLAAMSGREDGDCGWGGPRDARREFLERCGTPPDSLVAPRQVHGRAVLRVSGLDAGRGAFDAASAIGEADALVTNNRDVSLGICVADCVPVFLYAPETGAIGLVHAGREGVRQNIAGAAARQLQHAYGAKPEDMHAVIGPSAGPCCYEVSEEMAAAFVAEGFPARGRRLDLWKANRGQLMQIGLLEKRVHVIGHCTICGGGYHSHRAGSGSARNLAVMRL